MKRFTKKQASRWRPAPMFEIVGMSEVETRLLQSITQNNRTDSPDYQVLSFGNANLVTASVEATGDLEGKGWGFLEFWCELDKAEKAVEYIESQLEDPKRLAMMQSLIDAGI